ncbi:hypothetical protein [Pseudoalteromonas sp. GB56]
MWILILGLCGCVSTPKISKNAQSATVTVSTEALEEKSIHPDEAIYVHAFTSDQTATFDRAKNVSILKPDHTTDTFYLNSNTSYRLEVASNNFGVFNKASCFTTIHLTPIPYGIYRIQLDVDNDKKTCSLLFKEQNIVLIDKTFSQHSTYFIPIIIPNN